MCCSSVLELVPLFSVVFVVGVGCWFCFFLCALVLWCWLWLWLSLLLVVLVTLFCVMRVSAYLLCVVMDDASLFAVATIANPAVCVLFVALSPSLVVVMVRRISLCLML